MAKPPSSGKLYELVAFEYRGVGNPDSPNDYGNTQVGWIEAFRCRAEFIHLTRGEAVMAGRMEGRHTQVIRVRRFSGSDAVTTEYRVVTLLREGVVYNIRDIRPTEERQWIEFLAEAGVAT